jgi:hypothetical protein
MKNFFIKLFGEKYLYHNTNKICQQKYSKWVWDENSNSRIFDYFYEHLSDIKKDSSKSDSILSLATISFLEKYPRNFEGKIRRNQRKSYLSEIKHYAVDLSTTPFFDGEIPTKIYFDKNRQLSEVLFVNYNGLGGLLRKNSLFPVWYELTDCNIITELYSFYLVIQKSNDFVEVLRHGSRYCNSKESSYSTPIIASYDKNQNIDQTSTFWVLNFFEDNKTKILSHREYKELLKPLDINPDNFKNFSDTDIQLIKYYLMSCYAPKKFTEVCSKEDILNNLAMLKLVSY